MTFLVPFDGGDLSRAALVRALEYAKALDESVVAVSVIPDDRGYARKRGWIDPELDPDRDEDLDIVKIEADLEAVVHGIDEGIEFRTETIDSTMPHAIAREIDRVADDVGPDVVFVGSENAGSVVTPISSVGGEVAADVEYDVHIVKHVTPAVARTLRTDPALTAEGGSQ